VVKTYFDKDGNRKAFQVELLPDGAVEWTPDWVPTEDVKGSGIVVNHQLNRVECFCGHTEKFKTDSRASLSAARSRMSKHLRTTTEELERHREAYTLEFGS
jgi:hypothetical protein